MDGILIFLLLIVSYNFYGLYQKQLLFNKVVPLQNTEHLYDQVLRATSNLDTMYKIRTTEIAYINYILCSFKEDINHKYFNGKLSTDKKIKSLIDNEFFFFYLYVYLKQHEDDLFFNNSEYQLYTSKQNLVHSEFGVAFKRIQLIAAHYCCNRKNIIKIDPSFEQYFEQEKSYFNIYILQ